MSSEPSRTTHSPLPSGTTGTGAAAAAGFGVGAEAPHIYLLNKKEPKSNHSNRMIKRVKKREFICSVCLISNSRLRIETVPS